MTLTRSKERPQLRAVALQWDPDSRGSTSRNPRASPAKVGPATGLRTGPPVEKGDGLPGLGESS